MSSAPVPDPSPVAPMVAGGFASGPLPAITGALVPGDRVAGWRLDERVSESSFAEVWRASGRDDGDVAIKVARSDVGARMLASEVEVGRRLRGLAGTRTKAGVLGPIAWHPGAVAPGAPADARPYLVLPWMSAGSLRGQMDAIRTADDRARALGVVLELGRIVASVHARGIVHGDLKPENVLLDDIVRSDEDAPGGTGATAERRTMLADFGLARELAAWRLGRSLRHSLETQEGVTGGTLAYLPPEAVKGGPPTFQSDVYALGVLLHEVLLGRRPDRAVGPDEVRALLPDGVADVLLRALAFDPRDRYARAGDLAADLERVAPRLTATGFGRRALALGRALRAAAAAACVAFRYASVAALLASYAATLPLVLGIIALEHRAPMSAGNLGKGALALFVIAFLVVGFHSVIRWEGPETADEANARQATAKAEHAMKRPR